EAIASALELVGLPQESPPEAVPAEDARFDSLIELIDTHLRDSSGWEDEERLVVFTEYKTTLDYLIKRLCDHYDDSSAITSLFGGMEDSDREGVKKAFNDPESPVRILV